MGPPPKKLKNLNKVNAVITFHGGKSGGDSARNKSSSSSKSSSKTKAWEAAVSKKKHDDKDAHEKRVKHSVVSLLGTREGKESEKRGQHQQRDIGGTGNRAERLQVRLNMLEKDISQLKEKEEGLEKRLKTFTVQKYELASTIDGIHAKLEGLTREHKTFMEGD